VLRSEVFISHLKHFQCPNRKSPEDGGSMFLRNVVSPTSPHGITTRQSNIDILTAVRTSGLMYRERICTPRVLLVHSEARNSGRSCFACSQRGTQFGEIMFSLSYLPTAERLTVVIVKARNLKFPQDRESGESFVKVSTMKCSIMVTTVCKHNVWY
jgi:hypothetical protein